MSAAFDGRHGGQIELVIFDCDGVLVDSEAIHSASLAAAMTRAGLAMTAAEAWARYGGLLLPDIGAAAERELGRALPADFWERFEHDRRAAFTTALRAIDGARDTVTAVQAAGLRTCVASQASRNKTELTLGLTGLRDLFAAAELFSADDVAHGKPAPDVFLHAAASMGVPPASAVVVEDSASGIRAGVAADMRTIALAPSGAVPAAVATLGVEHVARLPEVLPLLGITVARAAAD